MREIDILIIRYLKGECAPSESEKLYHWRQKSFENEQEFRKTEETWFLAHTDRSYVRSNKRRVWNGIQRRIRFRYSLPTLIRAASIAASVAFVIGMVLMQLLLKRPIGNDTFAQLQPQQILLKVPGGVSSQITLPDGTGVWINSASTIKYPSTFSDDNRTVELVGEAYFDVVPDEQRPFRIKSGALVTKVLGTTFNFKHYLEDSHAIIAVETGKVEVMINSNKTVLLAGQYMSIDNKTLSDNVADIPFNYFSAWRENKLVFRDEPFRNVLNELSRRYNVDFDIRGREIWNYIYTATFDNIILEDALRLLKISSPIDYKIESLNFNQLNAYGKRKVIIYSKRR